MHADAYHQRAAAQVSFAKPKNQKETRRVYREVGLALRAESETMTTQWNLFSSLDDQLNTPPPAPQFGTPPAQGADPAPAWVGLRASLTLVCARV
jgi:hypothetical protein